MSRIAFIGLGAMGEPMAANMLKAGLPVSIVRHRRPDVVERLAGAGADVKASLADAVKACDTVVLCLPTSAEVEQVLLGDGGVVENAASGTLVIDCTTSSPASTARVRAALKAKGIDLVAAGLTRGVAGARAGTLACFIGGDSADVERAKAVLGATGDTFIEFASPEQAHTAKLISNVLSYASVALVSEALMLGQKSGVDLERLHTALMEGAPSKALEAFGSRMVAGSFDPPRVTVTHACDDFVMAHAQAAATHTPGFLFAAAAETYRTKENQGLGERDVSAIAEAWRKGPSGRSG